MKGIILSAGNGSRLLPLTRDMPKCLVEVEGRSILDWQLDALSQAGIADAIIVTGYRAAQIDAHLAASPPPLPCAVLYNPFWAVSSSIGSVWAARDALDAPFCLMNGDTIFSGSVIAAAAAEARPGVNLLVEPIDRPQLDDMRVAVCDGLVRGVAKDLPVARTTHRSLGVILSTGEDRAYAAALGAVIAAPGGADAYHHDIIARLAQTSQVNAVVDAVGGWQEIDRPEDIAGWTHSHHRSIVR